MKNQKNTQINNHKLRDDPLEKISGGLNLEEFLNVKPKNPAYEIKKLTETEKTLERARANSLRNIQDY